MAFMDTALADMQAWNPTGWMISNGPGDPSAMKDTIALIQSIIALEQPAGGEPRRARRCSSRGGVAGGHFLRTT